MTAAHPDRHLRPVPPPTGEPRWDPDGYRAAVFLDIAAGLVREFGLRRPCAATSNVDRSFCGRCIGCHLRSARTAYAAAQPNAPTTSLRAAHTIAADAAGGCGLDPTDPTVSAWALRRAAHTLYCQSLPAAVTPARIIR